MSRRVFFHIGLHKTATTWLQRHFFPNLDGVRLVEEREFEKILPAAVRGTGVLVVSRETLSGSIARGAEPGDKTRQLVRNLGRISAAAPDAGIIICFREHRAWLASAFAQKAKNRELRWEQFLALFSAEDLSWCGMLDCIEQSFERVFVCLYEELGDDPETLIRDLCGFLGTSPPRRLRDLLVRRENPSPRTSVGQRLTRQMRTVGWLRPFRRYGRMFIARMERGVESGTLELTPQMESVLRSDWNDLLARAEQRRGRGFSSLRSKAGSGGAALSE